jgi:hypothetical protein
MSPTLSFLIASAVVCVLAHLLACAWTGAGLGVAVREVSLGYGPALWRWGRFTLKSLPFGGFVKFKESGDAQAASPQWETAPELAGAASRSGEPAMPSDALAQAETHDALDDQGLAVQLAIGASGCVALLLIAYACLQGEGMRAVGNGLVQLILGGLSPLDKGQVLLAQARQALAGLPFVAVLGLVAAKFAAFNLLPLPGANGGFLVAVLARQAGVARLWPASLTQLLFLVYFALIASWLCALGVYLWR